MNRYLKWQTNLWRTVLVGIVFCSFRGAAQSGHNSPAEILAQALKTFRQQEGVHFSGTESNYNPFLDITVSGQFSGTYRNTGEIHYQCRDQFHSNEDEVYISGKRVIRRLPHSDRWKEGQGPNEALAAVLPLSYSHLLAIPNAWMEAALAIPRKLNIREENVASEKRAFWVIGFNIAGEESAAFVQALNSALNGAQPGAPVAANLKLRGEFRIDKTTLLIQRAEIDAGGGPVAIKESKAQPSAPRREFSDTLLINYRDYNQQLDLKLPADVQRLLHPEEKRGQPNPLPRERTAEHSAAELLTKAWDKSLQQAGYRFEQDSQTDPLKQTFAADGIFLRDGISMMGAHLVYNEMHVRYYLRGNAIAMTHPALGDRAIPFRLDRDLEKSHPYPTQIFLENFGREARSLASEMKMGQPEIFEDRPCRLVQYAADTKMLAERSALLQWDARVSDGSWPEFPLTGLEIVRGMEGWKGEGAQEQVRNLRWKVWIGADDGLIYRMQRQVTTRLEINEEKWRALGAQVREGRPYRSRDFVTTLDLRIREYNTNLEFDLPASVQQFFRLSPSRR
jgi:hypothetical protein